MKYLELVEDLKTIYTELSYNSRWVRIAMFHLIGKTLLENEGVADGHLLSIANALGVKREDIAAAIYFADKYSDLEEYNKLTDKTVSWDQLKRSFIEEVKNQ